MSRLMLMLASLALLSGPTEAGGSNPSEPDTASILEGVDLPMTKGGFGVGCTPVELPFSGTLVAKQSRLHVAKQPLPDAELWAYEQGNKPKLLEARSDADGAFTATVTGWDEIFYSSTSSGKVKRRRSEARVLVRVTAGGCEDRWIHVDRAWKSRKLVLKCYNRD